MKTISVAVIGAGGIANGVHFPSLMKIEGCSLAAVCDIDPEKAAAAAQKYQIPKAYTLYHEMLEKEKLDAAFVLVQPDQAFRIVLDCMNKGLSVFMEKPAGITLYQAETLVRAAKENHVQCQVGFNRRFIPLIETVREKLAATGKIVQADGWFFKHGDAAFYDGCADAFVCDAVHTIDLLRDVVGAKATRCAMLEGQFGDSPVTNAWNAIIQFDSGAMATVRSNYYTGGRVHGMAFHTGGASAYIDIGFGGAACKARILYHNRDTFSLASQGNLEADIEEIDGIQVAGSDSYEMYYGYYQEDRAFMEALQQGKPVRCGIEDAVQSMALIEKLRESSLNGRENDPQ